MERQVKQRVVGAAVLVVLAVIFIPLFLDSGGVDTAVPEIETVPPLPQDDFDSRIVPLGEDEVTEMERAATTPLPPPMVREEVAAEPPRGEATAAEPSDGSTPESAPATVSQELSDVAGGAAEQPVEVPAPRTEIDSWTVQLGSFGDHDNARRLIDRLREKSYPAYLERRDEQGKTVFKVRVGPHISRADADRVRDELETAFKLKGMLVRYR